MSEYNLDNVFDRFRTGGPLVIPAGPDAARKVHQHRRRVRVAAAGALAVALIAIPAVALAVDGAPDRVPPPPTDNTVEPVPSPPTPAPSASPTPSSSPSPPAVSATSGPPPLSGRFSADELGNATLELPAWPDFLADSCPSGRVRFRDGRAALPGAVEHDVTIKEVVHVDVDRDGADETAARIICSGLEQNSNKVLVFERDEAGGVATFGQVLTESGDIAAIFTIRKSGTAVEAQVVDYFSDGMPSDLMQFQWRGYSWDGSRFAQTGGPTAFPPNPKITDLSVAGQALRMTPSAAGQLSGTLTITVRNNGPHPAASPRIDVTLPAQLSAARLPAGCSSFRSTRGLDITCNLTEVDADAGAELVVPLTAPATIGTGTVGTYRAAVSSTSPSGGPYPEPAGRGGDNAIERDIVAG
ncbi:MAG TPA: hypothetical protein VHN18_15510 [Micromonosporaceae bacterium]|nr:hypothetical protein [Micromonosporaceae bacterium]